MQIDSFYPVIGTEKLRETCNFYTGLFNFEITFESDWYISLRHRKKQHFQLALLDFRHESVPKGFRVQTQGVLLNFEVDDVDAEYERIKTADLPIHLELKSEPWGQRHFITSDPNGLLIDVITIIPPSEEYANQYLIEESTGENYEK